MNPGKTNFNLEKLYLDLIDEAGNCFIIYRANLKFLIFKIYYSGLIMSDSANETNETFSLKKSPDPVVNKLLVYFSHFLQIRGSWNRTNDSLPPFSFRDPVRGELIWNCHHPKASSEIEYDDIKYRGYGYAETLKLTIKPWNLQIEELRWGRFLTDRYTVIWMNWVGANPVNKLFFNGAEYHDAIYEDDRIIFENGSKKLKFNVISIIRKGRLSDIFSSMPWLKIILNRRILNTFEIKYKAKSSLEINTEPVASGWSLYEIVKWGK